MGAIQPVAPAGQLAKTKPAAASQPAAGITVASRQPAVSQPADVPSQPAAHSCPADGNDLELYFCFY